MVGRGGSPSQQSGATFRIGDYLPRFCLALGMVVGTLLWVLGLFQYLPYCLPGTVNSKGMSYKLKQTPLVRSSCPHCHPPRPREAREDTERHPEHRGHPWGPPERQEGGGGAQGRPHPWRREERSQRLQEEGFAYPGEQAARKADRLLPAGLEETRACPVAWGAVPRWGSWGVRLGK